MNLNVAMRLFNNDDWIMCTREIAEDKLLKENKKEEDKRLGL
jgi:hypothetical protein